MKNVLLNYSVLAALVPTSLQAFRRSPARDGFFWVFLGIATVAPLTWTVAQVTGAWPTGFAATLWMTVAVTMTLYSLTAAIMRDAWRLAPLVAGYMLIVGVLATVWSSVPGHALHGDASEEAWVGAHIVTSLITYGLVTIAAITALAIWIQDQALKRKRLTSFSRMLPSVRDCERMLVHLLIMGEGVLALGLATGVALQYRETGLLFIANHKTILTLAAFVVLACLLGAYSLGGVRGKWSARVVLIGYLLLTLGYPGVKFVTDVLIP